MADVAFDAVSKQYPGGIRALTDFSLQVQDGDLAVLVGPSGCGKSTAIRMVAGLEAITSGKIRIGGKTVNDIPPDKRNVAMVFQNYALYPHMTVRDNLAFPLRMHRQAKQEITERITRASRLLNIESLLDRKPKQLSGGQRQRVAMGRAIVRDPDVFLMDEPLSNLDAKLRAQIRSEIAALHRRLRTTTIYVTHDQVEAMTLGQIVCVIREGTLQQSGPPREIYNAPANVFVAGFFGAPGMNVVPVTLHRESDTRYRVYVGDQSIDIRARMTEPFETDGPLLMGFRPEAVSVIASDRGVTGFQTTVDAVELLGHEQLIMTTLPGAGNTPNEAFNDVGIDPTRIAARLPLNISVLPGSALRLGVGDGTLHFFEPEGTLRRIGSLRIEPQ